MDEIVLKIVSNQMVTVGRYSLGGGIERPVTSAFSLRNFLSSPIRNEYPLREGNHAGIPPLPQAASRLFEPASGAQPESRRTQQSNAHQAAAQARLFLARPPNARP